jgi:hypothetical protein
VASKRTAEDNYYVYAYVRKPESGGRPYYYYERTCGTEDAAQRRVEELGPRAVYLVNHLIRGAFY